MNFSRLILATSFALGSASAADTASVPGSVLMASCEGLTVWDRQGTLGFAKIFTPAVDGAASIVPWGDMIYDGCRLSSGNYLASLHEWVRELTDKGEVVWELKTADITEFAVIIFGGFHRFENGNTVVANSDWYYKAPGENRVQLFEITHEKKVVWKLGVEAFAGKKPGSLEPKTGNIEHRIIGIQWLDNNKP